MLYEVITELWSVVEGAAVKEAGAPGANVGGSTAYPSMQTKTLLVNGREVLTDGEGYLVNLDDWSEGFVRVQAAKEGLGLTNEHWEVIVITSYSIHYTKLYDNASKTFTKPGVNFGEPLACPATFPLSLL